MAKSLMKCGHTSTSTRLDGSPTCVICWGLHPGADIVDLNPPNLEGRKAKCVCGKQASSATTLPFFKYREGQFDDWYCGHYGWD